MHHTITPLLARERTDFSTVVRAAQCGSQPAWERLVREFTPTLERIAAGFGLRAADVDDVVQVTWLDAYRSLGSLTRPAAIAGWLATTVRRNASRSRQIAARELPSELAPADGVEESTVLEALALEDRAQALGRAVRRLPDHQREILELMITRPGATYDDVAAELSMPIGSIGPTRARSFERLRRDTALVAALAA